uniref:Uncharacterized protein n=1 Tax=Prymnesium polylepis TaxID=72548 RepID=A0A7S4I4K0_9EUKA
MPTSDYTTALTEFVPTASWRLQITNHAVHKICNDELVCSTLRPFQLTIGMFDASGHTVEEHEPIHLVARCLFENGQPVHTLPGQPAILGDRATLANGQAVFRIQFQVLSSQREGKRFRVEVATDEDNPVRLKVISEASRTLTKLFRNPGGATAAAAAAQASPSPSPTGRNLSLSAFGKRKSGDPMDEASADAEVCDIHGLWGEVHRNSVEIARLKKDQAEMRRVLQALGEYRERRSSCSSIDTVDTVSFEED